MSPSEFELRAALRDGEGDGLDAGSLILHAEAVRRTRRVRVLTASASVIVVASLATSFALVHHTSHTTHTASGDAGAKAPANGTNLPVAAAPSAFGVQSNGAGASVDTAAGVGAGASLPDSLSRAIADGCPAGPPNIAQVLSPATADSIFTAPVTHLLVCGYRYPTSTSSAPSSGPVDEILTGSDAQAVATSLNKASSAPIPQCVGPAAPHTVFVLYGDYAGGKARPVVAVVDVCNEDARNGEAERYGWHPPAQLAALQRELDALALMSANPVAGPISPPPTPTENGSPAK